MQFENLYVLFNGLLNWEALSLLSFLPPPFCSLVSPLLWHHSDTRMCYTDTPAVLIVKKHSQSFWQVILGTGISFL